MHPRLLAGPGPSPSSPGSTSGESLSATEESEHEHEQEHEQDGQLTHPAPAGPATADGATHSATGAASTSSSAARGNALGAAGSSTREGTLSTRRRHHHHNHNLALGTGSAKMGSSITDSAQSTEDEMYEGEEEEEEEDELEGDDLDDENGRPVVHYPALATPTASKGSFWPFGTTTQDGMEDDPGQQQYDQSTQQQQQLLGRKGSVSSAKTVFDPASSEIHFNPRHSQQQRDLLQQQQLLLQDRNRSNAAHLPHEILLKILRNVRSTPDLVSSLSVCKSWCQCGVELLWNKPLFPTLQPLIQMLRILYLPHTTFPYASFIKRLNFSQLGDRMSDSQLMKLDSCDRLERLTLAGCSDVGDEAMCRLLQSCKGMVALDLSDCVKITDVTCTAISKSCSKLQGLNLAGCKLVADRGLQEVAKGCPKLRRVKLRNLDTLADPAIIALALHCPLLLEVDLYCCTSITDRTLWALFRNSSHLRELSLNGCIQVTGSAFPQKDGSFLYISGSTDPLLQDKPPLNHKFNSTSLASAAKKALQYYGPDSPLANATLLSNRMFEHVRYLDLTGLATMTDMAMEGIVATMPHIRNLVLAKCSNLTNDAVLSISKLGRHLHFLHLGHVSSITDKAIMVLAKSCTRLRYIDLACCPSLTDLSVTELAQNLPRLKRIGLVRVANLTDQAINELAHRTTLERIHLSYCENVSVPAIHFLLSKLQRLNHLSLTGVPAFRRADLQHFCRPPPKDFNAHQRSTFCVYSGKGVIELRRHLLNLQKREYMEGMLGNHTNAPLGTGGGGYAHPYANPDLETHAPLPPGFVLPGTGNGTLGMQMQDVTADLIDEDIGDEAEADGEDEGGDDDGDDEQPQLSSHRGGSSRSAAAPTSNNSHRPVNGHHHHHQQVRAQDAQRLHQTRSGSSSARASSSRQAGQNNVSHTTMSPAPSSFAPALGANHQPIYSTALQAPLPGLPGASFSQANRNVQTWFRWQTPQTHTAGASSLSSSSSTSYALPRPAPSSAGNSTSYLDTLPSPPQTGGFPVMQPTPARTASSAPAQQHYLNTEALHNLVDPSILRAAQEQEQFEQAAADRLVNENVGRDADGDQRMRSMSAELALQNAQAEEGDEEVDERGGRARRNTIKQSNYQMEQ